MNKTYRSIWNASLGCYVAAPESAVSHSTGCSSTRAVRSELPRQSGVAMVMETRIVFDGAMLVTAIDAAPAEAPVADAPVADHPADAVTTVAPVEAPAVAPADTVATASVATESSTPVAATATTEPVVATTTTTGTTATDTRTATPTEPVAETATPVAVDTAPAPLAVIEPAAASSHEIVFVDSRVPDISAFQGQGREVVVLTLEQDGLSQIADALAGRSDLDAIHIVSHGSDGVLTLGSTEVTTASMQSNQLTYLQSIGQALTADGDILIYACDYAAGSTGLQAMDLLADITGADVAASTDATGDASLGADWTLEQATGTVDTTALAPLDWMHALDFTFTPASTTGALGMANNIMGAGVTVVSATYQGGGTQSGTFAAGSGVTLGSNVLGFTSGTILSTGTSATGIAGPNNNGGFGSNAPGVDGDASLNALAGNSTFDAAILNVSFVPDLPPGATAGSVGRMTLEIVFGSEEYIEYVNQMNDVLEVTVNGQVVSLVPNASGGDSTIGINSVNTTQNTSLFVNNTAGTYNTQMDGFTVTIPLTFNVNLGQVNTIRLAVADAGDTAYDSWLLVRADSAQTVVVAEDDSVTTAANLPITVDLTANDYNLAGANLSLTQIQGQSVTQGQNITLGSGVHLTVGAGGQITVTGNGSSAVHDTFTYQVSNGLGGFASATVDVNITAPNLNPPVAHNDAEAVVANATHSDSVLTNNGFGADTDPNGDPLTVVQVNLTEFTPGTPVELPSGALLTMNANGSYVYNPNGQFTSLAAGATATDSFSYTITDGHGGNSSATVTFTITGVNDAPVAVSDSYTISETGATVLGSLTANDSDPDGDTLTASFSSFNGSNGGSFGLDDSGNVIFVPGTSFDNLAVGQTRTTSFSYTVSDGHGGSSSATVTVTVQGANDAPVAVGDAFDVSEDGAAWLGNLLANDSDPDSPNLSMTLDSFSGSNGGSFSTDDSGNLIFVAGSAFDDLAVGQTRQTSVTYTVSDDQGAQAIGTVTITVHGVNDAPVGTDDAFSTYEDDAVSLGQIGANDHDIDGAITGVGFNTAGPLDPAELPVISYGNVLAIWSSNVGDGPAGGLDGRQVDGSVVQSVSSLTAGSGLTLTGNPVRQAVDVAGLDSLSLDAARNNNDYIDVSFRTLDSVIDLSSLALGVLDSNGLGFGYTVTAELLPHGDVSLAQALVTGHTLPQAAAPGNYIWDQFNVDGPLLLSPQTDYTVRLYIYGNPTDQTAEFNDLHLFYNDRGPLDPSVLGAGDNGGLFSFDDSGNLIFNPRGEFNHLGEGDSRSTSFQYMLRDAQGASAVATVTVTVQGMNDAPVAVDDAFIAYEDTPMALGSLLANDSDADDGDTLHEQLASATGSSGGMFIVDDGGGLFFVAGSDFDDLQVGQFRDTGYTYTVSDDHGGSTQAQVTVTVMGTNDNPVGVADSYDADANVAIVLGGPVDNDTDVEGDSLSLVAFAPTAGTNGGIFSADEFGNLSFDPAGAFDNLAFGESCETSFTYEVQDGNGGVACAVVTVTVHGVDVTPVDPPAPVVDGGDAGAAPGVSSEIVFVDGRVSDPQAFAVDGREVVVLSVDQDGLAQMAAALSGRTGVTAVHIVSHGGDGYLTLGNGNIDANAVQTSQASALQTVAASLTADGDILIYACDFASGEAGQTTLQLLAQYTSADVAASTDTTGDASLGGDWTLEATAGTVEATTVVPTDWVHTLNLATPEGTAVAKQTAEIGLIAHTVTETKMGLSTVAAGSIGRGWSESLAVSGAVRTDASGILNAPTDLWKLADSQPARWSPGAADEQDGAATDGAAQGLRAQLSRWSSGFGQRPLTRGALRA